MPGAGRRIMRTPVPHLQLIYTTMTRRRTPELVSNSANKKYFFFEFSQRAGPAAARSGRGGRGVYPGGTVARRTARGLRLSLSRGLS